MHASLTDNVMFANASSAHGLADEVEAVLQDARDSLRRVDLFRCESILLKSHWVMAVMDQYTRRIIGFAVHAGDVDGSALCRTFNESISGQDWPKNISTDNDPLFSIPPMEGQSTDT